MALLVHDLLFILVVAVAASLAVALRDEERVRIVHLHHELVVMLRGLLLVLPQLLLVRENLLSRHEVVH